jgi:hypothetical protein
MEIEWEEFHCTEKMNYDDVLEYLKSIEEDDWRLPTVDELVEACKSYTEGFQRWGYWSSEKYNDTLCETVYFYTANVWRIEIDSLMYVRFVKDMK